MVALLTAGAGLAMAEGGGYADEVLAQHRWAGVICAGLAIVAWLAQATGRVWLARSTLGVLTAATVYAGHQGATLTHGPGVTAWREARAPVVVKAAQVKPGAEAVAGSVFEKEIQPLLQRSCIDCHGPDKARGRLRLDSREAVLAGGKSRLPSITPGKPEASELLRRVKLPRDDEDAMPPEDEPGLTAEEIAALEKWIAGGAVWH